MRRGRPAHVPTGCSLANGETGVTGGPATGCRSFWPCAIVVFFAAIAILTGTSSLRAADGGDSKFDSPNDSGVLRTATLDGSPLSDQNLFFKSLGTNGRSCGTCHVPSAGWTLSPLEVQDRFDRTDGRDPLFRTVDGSNSPLAKVNTLQQRRDAYSMLLNRGVIRVGLPVPAPAPAPGTPGADFALVA